ncbi:Hypothetical predicted protein, partial [Marmota monax]
MLATKPTQALHPPCPSKTTSISTCTGLLAAHPCRNPGGHCHAGSLVTTPVWILIINMGIPHLPPSWDTSTTAIVPYMWWPAPGDIRQDLETATSNNTECHRAGSLNMSPNATIRTNTTNTPSLKAATYN